MVYVPDIVPRPDLLILGITYRRVPVLSIGNDVYFDTSLIIIELERRFTPGKGHPSVYCELKDIRVIYCPNANMTTANNAALEHIIMQFYVEPVLFSLALSFIPHNLVTVGYKHDRKFYNSNMDLDAYGTSRPEYLSRLRSHLVNVLSNDDS